MKILYDLSVTQPLGNIMFHGGGEYCKALFEQIISENRNIIIEAFYDKTRKFDGELLELCRKKNVRLYDIMLGSELNELINEENYDVIYSALPGLEYLSLKFPAKTKFVFTQHGLRGLELISDKYQYFYLRGIKDKIKFLVKKILLKTTLEKRKRDIKAIFSITDNFKMITVSQHSKNSILYFFPELHGEQISVAASISKKNSFAEDECEDETVLDKFGIKSNKYMLIVSADRWEKNNYRMIKAIVEVLRSREYLFEGYSVLVLGDETGEIYRPIIDKKFKKYFIFKGYVKTNELEILYKNAYTFLYPSLNEGFGYPPIEAMKYKTLSLCAADSSITEVCGAAVLYFNPYNINEMAMRVIQSFDTEYRKSMEDKMVMRYEYISKIQQQAGELVIKEICGE